MTSKVIFLIGTLSGGGAERVVSNLSMHLPDDIETEIILFGKGAKIDYGYKGQINYLDYYEPKKISSKLSVLFKRIISLNKIKKKNPNAQIISFLEYPNLLNILSGISQNSIVSVRNFMSTKHKEGLKSIFWNLTIKVLYRRAKNVIVVSNEMKRDLVDNYNISPSKIKVIYNSYPISKIKNLSSEALTYDQEVIFSKPTIITAGRLDHQKGQHHLLKAFRKVKIEIPDAQLVILGEGTLKKQLKGLANDLQIADSVQFLGFKKNPFKFLSNAKIFVMTSYFEGFPNALAEAMACKLPVISTDCPSGPREILSPYEIENMINYDESNDRYGILVPPIDKYNEVAVEGKIADHIIHLLSNADKLHNYSNKSFERITDFDINKVIKEWEIIIRKN